MSIHPYIKMTLFLFFALSLSFGGFSQLSFGFILLLFGYLVIPQPNMRALWKMLCRLRWLWLSLIIFYFWFTPGRAMFEEFSKWSPSVEGIYVGMLRVGILVSMALASHLLFQASSREQLLASIRWLVTPLRVLGVHRDRFAVRLLLVFEAVPKIYAFYENTPELSNGNKSDSSKSYSSKFRHIGKVAAGLFEATVKHAETAPLHKVSINHPGNPRLWQWIYPLLLGMLLWGVSFLEHQG